MGVVGGSAHHGGVGDWAGRQVVTAGPRWAAARAGLGRR